ncbi:MAG: quinone-dependent dihydroorotate dehydrogenase [Alphaproteobacteria bacterium]|nr:quinone-dependent dihydroorotate dehydrogenase [Alphaproteobacteria bacterium]
MNALFALAKPVLHAMDAETAHGITIKALKTGLYLKDSTPDAPALRQTVFGLDFKNPVGIAAGFDKNADVLGPLFDLGFGFVEAGTVTPRPQAGNPRPRVFREPNSKSVINRMGFPGLGADVFEENLKQLKARNGIVGINIGKNKDTEDAAADYLALVTRFAPQADYLTINISSPNTPGLRDLQKPEFLLPFMREAKTKAGNTPLLVKLAPDLTEAQIVELAATLMDGGVNGLILGNTTLARPDTLPEGFRTQTGGLSGPHVREKSTAVIKRFYAETKGKLAIVGVGGIGSAQDAYDKIRAGACLVQLYTALVFEGPALVGSVKTGLAALLARDGFKNISEAVGK